MFFNLAGVTDYFSNFDVLCLINAPFLHLVLLRPSAIGQTKIQGTVILIQPTCNYTSA